MQNHKLEAGEINKTKQMRRRLLAGRRYTY
jgi:hypothetical protein